MSNSGGLTLKYLDGNQPDYPRVNLYFRAVTAWENFALQFSMAIELLRWINNGVGAFKKDDKSKEQRLYDMANMIKHTAKGVNSGEFTESGTIPVWLGNDGLHSFRWSITFQEASEILAELCSVADELQDPRALRERGSKDPQTD